MLMQPIEILEELVNGDYINVYLKAKAENICIICKEPAGYFRDQSSRLEYSISAICQNCQDSLFLGGDSRDDARNTNLPSQV